MKVVFINKETPKSKSDDKEFGRLLREKWERRDREKAEKMYGKIKSNNKS